MTTTHEADLDDITRRSGRRCSSTPLERRDGDLVGDESTVTSIVHIEGAWQGAVILRCPQVLGATLTSEMLGRVRADIRRHPRRARRAHEHGGRQPEGDASGAQLHLAPRRRARLRLRGRRAGRGGRRPGVLRVRRGSRGRHARTADRRERTGPDDERPRDLKCAPRDRSGRDADGARRRRLASDTPDPRSRARRIRIPRRGGGRWS